MLDRELLQIGRLVRDLQAAALLADGCHTHRRQWRRKRMSQHSLTVAHPEEIGALQPAPRTG